MARLEYQYNPLDLEPDVAIGVKLPFNSSPGGRSATQNQLSGSATGGGPFTLSYTTEEQSISNLKNLLLTRKGERLMHPTFGTQIYDSLFEPNTENLREILTDQLSEDIKFWLPYIIIDGLDVNMDADNQGGGYGYMISIKLSYRTTEQGANQVINIIVNQGGVGIIE
jgi:hypothetical protein